MVNVSEKDIQTLRALAARYMEYATSDKNKENKRLWIALNTHQMQKPLCTIDQIPWQEMDVDGFLTPQVKAPYFQRIEKDLRRAIYKWEHMPVDMVLNPYIVLPRPFSDTGYGIKAQTTEPKAGASSFLFTDQLATMEDVEKIKDPVLTLNPEKEAEILEAAHKIFDGIAPIKWSGILLNSQLWDFVSFWKGVENCYIGLLDEPELIHAIMERLTDATIAYIEQINKLGVYDNVSNLIHYGHTFDGNDRDEMAHSTTNDGWTYGMAQLFSAVSPDITEEFEVPYMTRIFKHFKNVYYGCCERLDDRLDIIDKMPNIRKISCSPWSNKENFAANLPKKYIMSNKPSPTFLGGSSFDEDVVRKDLRETINIAKAHGLGLEMLLKDLTTVNNDPRRLWRWSEIALEETMNSIL